MDAPLPSPFGTKGSKVVLMNRRHLVLKNYDVKLFVWAQLVFDPRRASNSSTASPTTLSFYCQFYRCVILTESCCKFPPKHWQTWVNSCTVQYSVLISRSDVGSIFEGLATHFELKPLPSSSLAVSPSLPCPLCWLFLLSVSSLMLQGLPGLVWFPFFFS